jgi:hypothetical protein
MMQTRTNYIRIEEKIPRAAYVQSIHSYNCAGDASAVSATVQDMFLPWECWCGAIELTHFLSLKVRCRQVSNGSSHRSRWKKGGGGTGREEP